MGVTLSHTWQTLVIAVDPDIALTCK